MAESSLLSLQAAHFLIKRTIEYHEYAKINSTYIYIFQCFNCGWAKSLQKY